MISCHDMISCFYEWVAIVDDVVCLFYHVLPYSTSFRPNRQLACRPILPFCASPQTCHEEALAGTPPKMAGLAVVVRAKKQLLKRAVQQPRIPPWSNAPTKNRGLESYEESHEEAYEEAYAEAYEEACEEDHEEALE